ncbi:delta-24-sterol reductase [Aureococcus anophagefferens]|nr:delta-24-sterol reductase [Aureococcus anophagefferens]
METVVAHLEPLGYRLPIVPELKHITVGGAISGVGIESGSFRHGWFHEALVSAEVLSPGGAILACGPDGEHADVFHALPNSYGTLGYVLRATLRLTPSKPVVAATTTVYGSFADAADAMRKAAASHEFVEGLWWAPDRVTVTVSDYAEQRAGETLRRFDGLDIYWKAVREEGCGWRGGEDFYLNLGTYTEIDVSFADAMAETKRIDDLCLKKHGGIKMLYSSSFVDKATYGAAYGTLDPATRAKVDPKGTRPSVFEKTAHPSVLDAGADLVLGY